MEEKMKAFVVLMLNELENAIELLRLWKSLWGHRKLAPVWELACWQKRGFVWGNFLHRLAAAETLAAVTRLRLCCRHSLARPPFLKTKFFCSLGLLVSSADVLAVPSVHKSLLVPAGYTGTGEKRELIQDFNILRSPKGDTPSWLCRLGTCLLLLSGFILKGSVAAFLSPTGCQPLCPGSCWAAE